MKTTAQLKTELDAANRIVKKEFDKAMRAGTGPSDAYKNAYAKARALWRDWSNALIETKAI